jgi:ribosome-associated protein
MVSASVVDARKTRTEKTRTEKTPADENSSAHSSHFSPRPLLDTSTIGVVRFCLDEMQADEIVEIDLVGKTSIADYMVIASGRANRHVGAIAERISSLLKQHGHETPRIEGMPTCDWVLIDAGDVLVHVFRPEVRQFYNLEKMWGADRPKEPVTN